MKKYILIILFYFVSSFSFSQDFIKEVACDLGPGTSTGLYCNLDIGSDNTVHMSHYDYLNKNLLYTTNAAGNWITIIIDSTGQVGEYNSIAIDSNNFAHISYFEFIRNDSLGGGVIPYGNFRYATNSTG